MSDILGFDHVQLAMPVGAEPTAIDFYEGVLGFERIPKPEHLAVRGGCWFVAGPVHIHMGVDPDFTPSRRGHPALLVRDLEALVARLAASGYEAIPGRPLEGYLRCDIADPFGNRIELMQRT